MDASEVDELDDWINQERVFTTSLARKKPPRVERDGLKAEVTKKLRCQCLTELNATT